jgi:hypothetical protein
MSSRSEILLNLSLFFKDLHILIPKLARFRSYFKNCILLDFCFLWVANLVIMRSKNELLMWIHGSCNHIALQNLGMLLTLQILCCYLKQKKIARLLRCWWPCLLLTHYILSLKECSLFFSFVMLKFLKPWCPLSPSRILLESPWWGGVIDWGGLVVFKLTI